MGYFDALTSSSFKTTPDGQRLFFPWGVRRRGYVIRSDRDHARLRGQVRIFNIIAMASLIAAVIGALALREYLYLAGLAIAALSVFYIFYIAFYVSWLRYLLRGLHRSHERL